jgi:hypothetical protein
MHKNKGSAMKCCFNQVTRTKYANHFEHWDLSFSVRFLKHVLGFLENPTSCYFIYRDVKFSECSRN